MTFLDALPAFQRGLFVGAIWGGAVTSLLGFCAAWLVLRVGGTPLQFPGRWRP